MRTFLIIALSLGFVATATAEETFYDARGRVNGTATTSADGQVVTFRGAGGRVSGTASTDSNGTITIRDAIGHYVGTVQRAK